MNFFNFLKYPLMIICSLLALVIIFWTVDLAVGVLYPPLSLETKYGITFSNYYAQSLGLDPNQVYQNALEDLGVKKIRIPVYWDSVEPGPGRFDFQDYDWMLDLAREHHAQVILVLGYKVPRWPECFAPGWAKNLTYGQHKEQILQLLEQSVAHFQDRQEIVAWQVENEPLLNFGQCRMFDRDFLKQEVDLVRSKDKRPIILTDSGELGWWVTAMQFSDIMGTSLYRTVWNPFTGFFRYPFPPLYYQIKAEITRLIFARHSQGVFVTELQAEPWTRNKSVRETSIEEQIKIFSLDHFKEAVNFTARTHLKEQYFWGVEWWYWMKLQGHPEYWEYAKILFQN